jgi:hypothetical protein
MAGAAAGEVGDAAAEAGVELLTDPSLYAYGWEHAWQRGMATIETEVEALGAVELEALLLAAVEQAVGDMMGADSPKQEELGIDIPSPSTNPKGFIEYLRKRGGPLDDLLMKTLTETLATGTVSLALEEATEFAMTGDTSVDAEAVADLLYDALKGTGKKMVLGGAGALGAARNDQQTAQRQFDVRDQHEQRMEGLAHQPHDLSTSEVALYRAWSSLHNQAVPNTSLPSLSSPEDRALETFQQSVLRPLRETVTTHRNTAGRALSVDTNDAWAEWVMENPNKATDRAEVDPVTWDARRRSAAASIAAARQSDGYEALSDRGRQWYEHAATNPERFADLTTADVELASDVTTLDGAAAFEATITTMERKVAKALVGQVAAGLSTEDSAWARANTADIVSSISAVDPADLDAARATIRERIAAR